MKIARKKKRLNFKDDFELLYLRHEYIERAKELGKEFDSSLINKYKGIVRTTAQIMFKKLRPNFQKVGFDQEDFFVITTLYMLYYMALYSIQTNPEEMQTLLDKKNIQLSEDEILRIDRNRLISFLRQKLGHCATLFARKARSITVGSDKRGFFAKTENSVDASQEMLIEDHKKYGYRKVTLKEYKLAQENLLNGEGSLVDKNGFEIIKVEILNQGIGEYDYRLLTENEKGSYYNAPDEVLQATEDQVALEAFQVKFQNMDDANKKELLKKFIKENKKNKHLKTELRLAKKLLLDMADIVV